jgi:hypothetical protein
VPPRLDNRDGGSDEGGEFQPRQVSDANTVPTLGKFGQRSANSRSSTDIADNSDQGTVVIGHEARGSDEPDETDLEREWRIFNESDEDPSVNIRRLSGQHPNRATLRRSPSLGLSSTKLTSNCGPPQYNDLEDDRHLQRGTIQKLLRIVQCVTRNVSLLGQEVIEVQLPKTNTGMIAYSDGKHHVAIWIDRGSTLRIYDSKPNGAHRRKIRDACDKFRSGEGEPLRIQEQSPIIQEKEADCGVCTVAVLCFKVSETSIKNNIEGRVWRRMLKCLLDDISPAEERHINAMMLGDSQEATAEDDSFHDLLQGITVGLPATEAKIVDLNDCMAVMANHFESQLHEASILVRAIGETLCDAYTVFERLETMGFQTLAESEMQERRVVCEAAVRFRRLRLCTKKSWDEMTVTDEWIYNRINWKKTSADVR